MFSPQRDRDSKASGKSMTIEIIESVFSSTSGNAP